MPNQDSPFACQNLNHSNKHRVWIWYFIVEKNSFYTRSFGIFQILYLQNIWQNKIDQSWIAPIWPNFCGFRPPGGAKWYHLLFERIVVLALFLLGSSFTSSDFVNGFENFSSNSFHFEMDSTIFEFGFFSFLTITALNVSFCLKHVWLSVTHGLCGLHTKYSEWEKMVRGG